MVELLEVTVWDSDEFMNDSCPGVVEVDIAEDVAKVPGGRIYKTWYLQVRTQPGFLCAPVQGPASACIESPLQTLQCMAVDLGECMPHACCRCVFWEQGCGSFRGRASLPGAWCLVRDVRLSRMCTQDVPKDQKTKHTPNANITLQIQWVPFDFTF